MNAKQRRFAEEYLKDLNATQAAIRAGYSERTAYSQGQRLLKHVEVKNTIKEIRERIQSENIATIKDIEEYLSRVMRGEEREQTLIGQGMGEQGITDIDVSAKDRIKAAELLGKRYAMWTDKIDSTGNMMIVFEDDYGEDPDDS